MAGERGEADLTEGGGDADSELGGEQALDKDSDCKVGECEDLE